MIDRMYFLILNRAKDGEKRNKKINENDLIKVHFTTLYYYDTSIGFIDRFAI